MSDCVRRIGRLATAATLLFAASRVRAQDARGPHDAQPERPTVATHAGTVAIGWLELESGIEADRLGPGSRQLTTPTVLKFGLADHVQLSVMLNTVRAVAPNSYGVGDVALGVKWRLVDDAPLVGDFAILPAVKFPTGSASRGTGTGTTDESVILISSHELGPVSLDINVGYTRRSGAGAVAPTSSSVWTVSTGFPLAEKFGWTAEVFGYPGTSGPAGGGPSVGFLTGPTLQMHAWFVADAGIIANVHGGQPPALYAGLTWNVGRVW